MLISQKNSLNSDWAASLTSTQLHSLNMGTSLSIDKEPTALDGLLSTSPAAFAKTQEDSPQLPHTHHLKIWRFAEDLADPDLVKYSALNLAEPQDFCGQECYIVLLIYRHEPPAGAQRFPHSLWGVAESLSNLTPRGLENAFSTDDSACLDTFLLSKRPAAKDELHYTLFVWNGKRAGALAKAITLTRGFELDTHLVRGKLPMLHALFSGCVVHEQQVRPAQLGSLEYSDESSSQKTPEQAVYLLKWLWPEHPAPARPLFPKFKEHFLAAAITEPLFVPCESPKLQIVLKPQLSKLNLAGLQTREDQRNELLGLDKEQIDGLDNADVRDTVRKDIKFAFYNEICSEVDDGLFVGSDTVARDRAKLKAHGVTHIVNCAANVCKDYFPGNFTYLHYFLKDARTESIECVFYEVIEFIETALNNGGKVYVHCMQGVSRSVTVCLAYMIYRHKHNFDTAFKRLKEVRGVASPNFGFQAQLIWWYKRLYDDYDSIPVAPRVFSVGSHQPEAPNKVVCRLLMENPFQNRNAPPLDSRAVYLIQTSCVLYLWTGHDLGHNKDTYMQVAHKYIEKLRAHERAQGLVHIADGEETEEFWGAFGVPPLELVSAHNDSMNHWHVDLDTAVDQEPQALNEGEDSEDCGGQKPTLFVYPEDNGLTVFDDDELGEETLLVLCTEKKCFVWQGEDFVATNRESYVALVCEKFYDEAVPRVYESPGRESEDFMNFFDN